jgi:hypothetical protein
MNMNHYKYPRTLHVPWSKGITSDDKVCKNISHFEGLDVVLTEKMDGENTSLYRDHIHARSLDSRGGEDRAWVKQFWSQIQLEIPDGWRICGENLLAQHSIRYENLSSYFYGFSIWNENNICLDWKSTLELFSILNITPVHVLYSGVFDGKLFKEIANQLDEEKTEGYVIRLADSFSYEDFGKSVAKYVRSNHVKTDKHWRTQIFIPNTLKCYENS